VEIIVIPNRNDYGIAWCLEYGFEKISNGEQVAFVDFSREQYRYRKKSRYWIDRFVVRKPLINLYYQLVHKGKLREIPTLVGEKMSSQLMRSISVVADQAIKSSYAWNHGSSRVDLDALPKDLVEGEREIFLKVYASTVATIKKFSPSRVVTVNGRFVVDGAVVLAAKSLGVEYRLLERDSENLAYYAFFSISSQSDRDIQVHISESWKAAKGNKFLGRAQEIGRDYIVRKSKFRRTSSEVRLSHFGLTLKKLSKSVVFFPTSDIEFSLEPSTQDSSENFKNQEDAFQSVVKVANKMGLEVIVRTHPHPKNSHIGAEEDRIWSDLCRRFGTQFISSTSEISSYDLAMHSWSNVVHGSSIGAEIAFESLPIILTGEESYSHLAPELVARTETDLERKIATRVAIIEPNRLLAWGYYLSTGSRLMQYFKMSSATNIYYNGTLWAVPRKWFIFTVKILSSIKRIILGIKSINQ